MKLSDFVLLNETQKKTAVLHNGVLIGKRKDATAMNFLFQLEGFYVEAVFEPNSKELETFRMFTQSALLEPYLQLIPLDDLWS